MRRVIIITFLGLAAILSSAVVSLAQDDASSTFIQPLEKSTLSLPRYNFWLDYSRTYTGYGDLTIDPAHSSKRSFQHSGREISLSADYHMYSHTIPILPGLDWQLSLYFGGKLGYLWDTYTCTDYFTLSKTFLKSQYFSVSPFLTLSDLGSYFSLGFRWDFLTQADVDTRSRDLVGFGPDCFTPIVYSIVTSWGYGIGRVKIGLEYRQRLNDIISESALEYYKGPKHKVNNTATVNLITIAIVLGGTDR